MTRVNDHGHRRGAGPCVRGSTVRRGARGAAPAAAAALLATLGTGCPPPTPPVVAIDPTPPVLVPPPRGATVECAATSFTPCAEGQPCPVVRALRLCGAIEALLPVGGDEAELVVALGSDRLLVHAGPDGTPARSLGPSAYGGIGLLPWRGGRWRVLQDGGVVRGVGTLETIGGVSPSARLLRAGADGDDAAWAFFLDGANVVHAAWRGEDWTVEPVRSDCWTPVAQYRVRGEPFAACADGSVTNALPGIETSLPATAVAPLVLDTAQATVVAWSEPITASPEDTTYWSQLGQYGGQLPALFVARAGAEATDRKATVMAPAVGSSCTAAGWQQADAYQRCTVRGEWPADFRLAATGDGTPWVVWTLQESRLEQGTLVGGNSLEVARLVVGDGTPTVEHFARLALGNDAGLVRLVAGSGTRLHVALQDRYLVLDTALPAAPPPPPPRTTAVPGPAEQPCPREGQVRCGERCVDLQRDEANCGACGLACDPGWSCAEGGCVGPECHANEDCPDPLRCDLSASFPCEPSAGCTCTTDAECGVDAVCVEGLCELKECRRSSDCSGPGASCRRGAPGQRPRCMPRGNCS